ncbi:DUF3192 domain-containing protein [Pseudoalteromonas piscicida]|uniref:DUF3192 domain-containing protein n=1 Tax=Pseudoalteromonas piscicida TaxID=43662 RepID=A0AAD0RK88_PSEO7|nr:DUF3192 domain-containing protein [Pseudoalteromonas piscicida]ASD69286.1 hypothetical protein B1L02_20545 [Pseudoalteromonas piscicida]AXQ99897.1 DUF3192 domain-containing protein [Pseudoalteromonas piscicida]AXR04350.1 DUF3192 domain-containing protein [Pseudoalteromonas piscicida]
MIRKILQYIFLGLAVYVTVVFLVINYYKDDPQAMIWQDREAFNNRFIRNLSLEKPTELDTVLDTLGSPDLTYVKKKQDDTIVQIVFYRTQLVKPDGITTEDECTGLLFENGILKLWGPGARVTFDKVPHQLD